MNELQFVTPESRMSLSLLPCPFCGGAVAIEKCDEALSRHGYLIVCNTCDEHGSRFEYSVEEWNRRSSLDKDARIAALEQLMRAGRHAFNDLNQHGKTILDLFNVWRDQDERRIAALEQRAAEAERDAGRYRWIRESSCSVLGDHLDVEVDGITRQAPCYRSMEVLDAYVDATMEAEARAALGREG